MIYKKEPIIQKGAGIGSAVFSSAVPRAGGEGSQQPSWNCRYEGVREKKKVILLFRRKRDSKNLQKGESQGTARLIKGDRGDRIRFCLLFEGDRKEGCQGGEDLRS